MNMADNKTVTIQTDDENEEVTASVVSLTTHDL